MITVVRLTAGQSGIYKKKKKKKKTKRNKYQWQSVISYYRINEIIKNKNRKEGEERVVG